jgi:predicted metal-dependent hydrolase
MNLQINKGDVKKSPRRIGEHSIAYGDELIFFKREDRVSGVLRVLIQVKPDCSVVVQAPNTASPEAVLAAVKKRARWIYNQLKIFRAQLEHSQPRRFVSGESHYYLGKQYVLKVIESNDHLPCVKLLRGKVEVVCSKKSGETVKSLLDTWYKERAKEVLHRRLEAMLEQTLWVKKLPPLRVQAMQKQWGSCSPSGRLTLNTHLVKAPRECIDYVILHELCHLAEHNHSKKFYRLMTQVMPNWEKVKAKLDGMVERIL